MRVRVEGLTEVDGKMARAAAGAPALARRIIFEHAPRINEAIKRASPSKRVADSSVVEPLIGAIGAIVGPTHPLSHLIEYGTGPRWQKKTGRYTGVMPPNPFIGPVFESRAPRVVASVERRFSRL